MINNNLSPSGASNFDNFNVQSENLSKNINPIIKDTIQSNQGVQVQNSTTSSMDMPILSSPETNLPDFQINSTDKNNEETKNLYKNPYLSPSTLTVLFSVMDDLIKLQGNTKRMGEKSEIEAKKMNLNLSELSAATRQIMGDIQAAQKIFNGIVSLVGASIAAFSLYNSGKIDEKAHEEVKYKIEQLKESASQLEEQKILTKELFDKNPTPLNKKELDEVSKELKKVKYDLSDHEDNYGKKVSDLKLALMNEISTKKEDYDRIIQMLEKTTHGSTDYAINYLNAIKEISDIYKDVVSKFSESFRNSSSQAQSDIDKTINLENKITDTAFFHMRG